MRILSWSIVLAAFLFAPLVNAELILSAPPRETPQEGARVYGPLAEYLSNVVGEKVTYMRPNSWAQYSSDIWDDRYDFVFDGPHFAAWRMVNKGHRPLVRLEGNLQFYVIAHNEPGAPKELSDLKMQPVCAISSPNMTAAVLLAQFSPVSPPSILPVKGGMKGVYQRFMEKRCKAAVLRAEFVEKLPPEKRSALVILFRSAKYPNQSVTASPRVKASFDKEIISNMTDPVTASPLKAMLKRFGYPGMNESFVHITKGEFSDHNQLLEGVVWGW